MTNKSTTLAASLLLAAMAFGSTGCVGLQNMDFGFIGIPIPVSPYFQDKQEDEFREHERYERAVILGPLTAGGPAVALDTPSDDEVMVALEKSHPVEGGIPMLHEVQRNNVRIVKEKISDYVDPPRVYPLIGPAQLHHAHYRCTVRSASLTEVVYVDHNHLHMIGAVQPAE